MSKDKFTRETVDKILRGLRYHLTPQLACKYAGISYETFLNWERGRFPRNLTEEQEVMKASFANDVAEAKAASLATMAEEEAAS